MVRIGLLTNYNNKLGNLGFYHLGELIEPKPPLGKMEGMIVELYTKDGSHEPVVKELYTLQTVKLCEISDFVAIASHGIPAKDFIDQELKKPKATLDKPLCIYFYCSPGLAQRE